MSRCSAGSSSDTPIAPIAPDARSPEGPESTPVCEVASPVQVQVPVSALSTPSRAWPQLQQCAPKDGQVQEESPDDPSGSDEDDEGVMCAICHGSIAPLEVALVRGCDHSFCCKCILNWALQKAKCPLCQTKFTHLWVYRMLDGTYNDYLVEENVEVLHCAQWFRKAVVTEFSQQPPEDEDEEYHELLQANHT